MTTTFKKPSDFSKDTAADIKRIVRDLSRKKPKARDEAALETLSQQLEAKNKAVTRYLSAAEVHNDRHYNAWRVAAAVVGTALLTGAGLAVAGVITPAALLAGALALPVASFTVLVPFDIISEKTSPKGAVKRAEKLAAAQERIKSLAEAIKNPPAPKEKLIQKIKRKASKFFWSIFSEPEEDAAAPAAVDTTPATVADVAAATSFNGAASPAAVAPVSAAPAPAAPKP